MTPSRIFLLIAVIVFALAAFGVSVDKISLIPIGLAFFAGASLI